MEQPPRAPSGLKPLFIVLGVLAFLGCAGAIALFVIGGRIARTVKSRLDSSSAGESVGRVVQSLHTVAREEKRPRSFGCGLLSREDAAAIAGTAVTRVESTSTSCAYFGVPDPSIQPEAIALKGLPGMSTDPQVSKMIDQATAGLRASVEQQDPGTRAGPGGERLLFSIDSTSALSATMELGSKGRDPKAGGEDVPGIGDDAYFLTMHRMFLVRKGAGYLLVQPQFVKDPRAVCIAAARKVLASPDFGP